MTNDHRTEVQHDRARVICLSCTWFKHDASMSEAELRQAGFRHKDAARER